MINTGLLLRRPHESFYSAYRRFLVANSSYRNDFLLRKQLLQVLEIAPETPSKSIELAQLWEQRYCDRHQIRYERPKSATLKPPSFYRNCPDCAKACFHSYLFDYPWVRVCPVHLKKIVLNCPDCHQAWPMPSELVKRRCLTCGARVCLQYLANVGALAQFPNMEVMDTISEVLTNATSSCIELKHHVWQDDQTFHHTSVTPASLSWPSFVLPRTREWEAACKAVDAPLEPIIANTFALGKPLSVVLPSNSSPGRSISAYFERHHRKKATLQIKRLSKSFAMRPPFPEAPPESREKHDFLGLRSRSRVFKESFDLWQALVSAQGTHRVLPYSEYFKTPAHDHLPPRPASMQTVLLQDELNSDRTSASGERYVDVPSQLQAWLYQVDLWWTFAAIISYRHAFNEALKTQASWLDFFNGISEDADPLRWSEPRVHLSIHGQGELCVALPLRHGVFSLDSMHIPFVERLRATNILPLRTRFGPRYRHMDLGDSMISSIQSRRSYKKWVELSVAHALETSGARFPKN